MPPGFLRLGAFLFNHPVSRRITSGMKIPSFLQKLAAVRRPRTQAAVNPEPSTDKYVPWFSTVKARLMSGPPVHPQPIKLHYFPTPKKAPAKVVSNEVKPATESEIRAMYAAADPRAADLSHMSLRDKVAVFRGAWRDENPGQKHPLDRE